MQCPQAYALWRIAQVNFVLIGLLAQIVANAAEAIRLSLVQVSFVPCPLTEQQLAVLQEAAAAAAADGHALILHKKGCAHCANSMMIHTSSRSCQTAEHSCAAQVLLQRQGLRLHPVAALYYVAPCCLGFLTVPWAALEAPRLLAAGQPLALDAPLFLASALAAFALNASVSGAAL
jgi:hypothetical protein